ncbi:hypothetical protein Ptr902_06640 [Pyrenophora tritici-repentis]|uniref:Uncharacterized protein n=1 Tax=Pyrenophora tritici-repentis TaxID=45151 RepID=A0A5M9LKY5_9PLEO|nr:hypothetical protein PtrV1_00248 [Pyrenophora tritici-repentis]KAF7576014.1 hypothetical protein PtrM4_002540 [Pyrenophora tritici-repentis]KAI0579812.1 hypothetical protein Alg215_05557 [Pyrenophora tritici-repentis]KAI0585206.1 hypothetical protein Alg130_04846 [Pyrenophora tritici-repentis]KAI0610935.1 hypothetical protein TUN205_04808 [Pyrenophora tritici-repentis]
MTWHTLCLFLSFLFCRQILAQRPYPLPNTISPGRPFAPPPFKLISHPCAIDITGTVEKPAGTKLYTGGTFHCGAMTIIARPDKYCSTSTDRLYVYGILNARDTFSLYFIAGHLGGDLYDTTATFSARDFGQPRHIGCVIVGDGVSTTLYSYVE